MKNKNQWIIIFVSIFMIVSLSRSVVDLWERRKIVKEEQERLALVEKKHQELTEKLKMVQTPAFVEKEARDHLGMAKPGDTVIIMDTSSDNEKEHEGILSTNSSGQVPYWKRWWMIFF
jgi:cell division protein FtsB